MIRCAIIFFAILGCLDAVCAWGTEVEVSGLVDMVHRQGDKRTTINNNLAGDSPFSDLRVKLFLDAWPSSNIGVLTEILFDESGGTVNVVRIDGAYAVFMGTPAFNLKAGKIPSPFGAWAPRTYSDKNPLIGLPLMYHYHTIARSDRVPANFDTLQTYRRLRAPGRGGGMPILYDSCWNLGMVAFGGVGRWEYNVGVGRGTPSTMRASTNDGFQVIGRVGIKPMIGLRMGVSGAYGPYLVFGTTGLPSGARLEDYKQRLFGFDLEYGYGHLLFFSEFVRNRWDSPRIREGLANTSWYVEWKYTFWPGFYGAARYSGMRFDKIDDGKGGRRAWDSLARRVESGIGYHISRSARFKLVWQYNYFEGEAEERVNLYAGQLSVSF